MALRRAVRPDPWHAKTLEWCVPSPPALENFGVLPVVTGDAYGYGDPDSHHTAPLDLPGQAITVAPVAPATMAPTPPTTCRPR